MSRHSKSHALAVRSVRKRTDDERDTLEIRGIQRVPTNSHTSNSRLCARSKPLLVTLDVVNVGFVRERAQKRMRGVEQNKRGPVDGLDLCRENGQLLSLGLKRSRDAQGQFNAA